MRFEEEQKQTQRETKTQRLGWTWMGNQKINTEWAGIIRSIRLRVMEIKPDKQYYQQEAETNSSKEIKNE